MQTYDYILQYNFFVFDIGFGYQLSGFLGVVEKNN